MLKFKNGKFVILQVSDPQDLQWVRPAMVKMLDKAYDVMAPDLVIFTGDNILGNHLRDARFGSRKTVKTVEGEKARMKTAIAHICEPVEKRGIPFTMIYGNHDDMNEITKEEQADIFRSYSCCVGVDGSEETTGDAATFALPVFSSDGEKKLFNLWCVDSAWMDKDTGKCHTVVKKKAVDWYLEESERLKEENGGEWLPSIMFQHVPAAGTSRLTERCSENDPGAVREHGKDGSIHYVRLDPAKASGFLGEGISECREDYGQLDAVKKQGDVKAMVFGHDHVNCFEGFVDGVRIIQTPAASFRCYGNSLRGVRVFVLDENSPADFTTYTLSYSDICGTGLAARARYIFDADGEQVKKGALILSAAALAAGTAAAGVKAVKIIDRRREK